jgi:hypothetical protein
MADDRKCCNHDHVGNDEQWLTVGEIADVVFDATEAAVTSLLALPSDASREERRTAMRAEFDRQRAEVGHQDHAATAPTRRETRDERARRRWS